jgi:hypothetical protein
MPPCGGARVCVCMCACVWRVCVRARIRRKRNLKPELALVELAGAGEQFVEDDPETGHAHRNVKSSGAPFPLVPKGSTSYLYTSTLRLYSSPRSTSGANLHWHARTHARSCECEEQAERRPTQQQQQQQQHSGEEGRGARTTRGCPPRAGGCGIQPRTTQSPPLGREARLPTGPAGRVCTYALVR